MKRFLRAMYLSDSIFFALLAIAGVLVFALASKGASDERGAPIASPQSGPPILFISLDAQTGGTDRRYGDAGFIPLVGWSVDRMWITYHGSYYPGYIPEDFVSSEKVNPSGNSFEWYIRNDRFMLPLYGTATLKVVFNKPGGGQQFVTRDSDPNFLVYPYAPTTGQQGLDWY